MGGRRAVDGLDDFVGVNALQVDRGHAKVAVAELALDDVERDAFVGEFDGVRVAQLVRGEAAAHAGAGGGPARQRDSGQGETATVESESFPRTSTPVIRDA